MSVVKADQHMPLYNSLNVQIGCTVHNVFTGSQLLQKWSGLT